MSVIMFYRLRIDVKTSEVKRKFKTKLIFLSLTCTLSGDNFPFALYQLQSRKNFSLTPIIG